MLLKGKVAVVTGGGYGIDRAIALAFVKEGADVLVAARTEPAFQEVASEIESLGRMVKPEEVADLAVFLASSKSSGITGQTINIDAGTNFN
jgi:NAD(P)-dependent dehydrogenase (short-subunit alcohol dehydrogenase family)